MAGRGRTRQAAASPDQRCRERLGGGRARPGHPVPRRSPERGTRVACRARGRAERRPSARSSTPAGPPQSAPTGVCAWGSARSRCCSPWRCSPALLALEERGKARSRERTADAQRLGAVALAEPALDRSLLLAREAVALDDNAATQDTMLAALLRSRAAIRVMRGDGGRMLAVAARPDGEVVAAGDNAGRRHALRRGRSAPRVPVRQRPPGAGAAVQPGRDAPGRRERSTASSTCSTRRRCAGSRDTWLPRPSTSPCARSRSRRTPACWPRGFPCRAPMRADRSGCSSAGTREPAAG